MKDNKEESVLHVFQDRSVLYDNKGKATEFKEGKLSDEAKARLKLIKDALSDKFLAKSIETARRPYVSIDDLDQTQIDTIESLVSSVTSEVGRAIVGLAVLQLTIKSICPDQSIRLHKGSTAARFSWVEGVPMRVLDKNFITPELRNYKLLRLNADGFMMTRSLAENYPYSQLYKAAIRGAKEEWVKIVDWVENSEMNPHSALIQLLIFLNNRSEDFSNRVDSLIATLKKYLATHPNFDNILGLIKEFIDESTYSARIFEISIHSLFQVFDSNKCLEGFLKPISQMRSANKKHGNIGDIEITISDGKLDILEAWDAKYGKTYLRDELEEIDEKLTNHSQCRIAGFVTDTLPNQKAEIIERIEELSIKHDTQISILDFNSWVNSQIERHDLDKDQVGTDWLIALAESLSQLRRDIAPIDEPTGEWVSYLDEKIKSKTHP